MRLCGNENPTTPLSTSSGHEGSTSRQDAETHIAFGTKVVIPAHLRRNPRLSSSKTKQYDARYTSDDLVKSPLSPKGSQDNTWSDSKGIDANQATIQPRPPRTSSAGKIRRPIRLKSGKTRTAGKTDDTNEKQPHSLQTETSSLSSSVSKINAKVSENSEESRKVEIMNVESSVLRTPQEEQSKILDVSETAKISLKNMDIVKHELDEKRKTVNISACGQSSDATKLSKQPPEKEKENDSISLNKNNDDVRLKSLSGFTNEYNVSSKILTENSVEKSDEKLITNDALTNSGNATLSSNKTDFTNALVNKSINKQSLDTTTPKEDSKNIDMNNNELLTDKDADQRPIRPRKLPLAANNPVFTFASMPRSPRSGKRKLLDSPMVDDVITPSVEAPPEVMVSLCEDTPVNNGSQSHRNRGASLEDDFCKLSG